MLTDSDFTTPREGTPSRHRIKPRHTLLAWQRNGLTAGSQDWTLKADRIAGLSDGTPEEAERGGRLETPPPHPQAVAAPEGTHGGGEGKEGRQEEWGREAMNEQAMEIPDSCRCPRCRVCEPPGECRRPPAELAPNGVWLCRECFESYWIIEVVPGSWT